MNTKVTIKDIARIAGVSVSTVSRAINDDNEVSKKTKEKIDAIIREQNYRPSMLARGMVSKRTNMIALIVSDITNPYFYQFIANIEETLIDQGYTLSLFDTQTANAHSDSKKKEIEINIFKQIQENNFDAVILLGGLIDQVTLDDEYLTGLQNLANDIPTIIVGRRISQLNNKNAKIIFIERDQELVTQFLVTHVIKKGYKKIAFIGGNASGWVTVARVNAFRNTLRQHGLAFDEQRVVNNNFYAQDGYDGVLHLLERNVEFDAIIAINDRVAQGVIRGLIDVVEESTKIGVASCEHFTESIFNNPRITSVDHNLKDLSKLTVETLISLVEGSEMVEEAKKILPRLVLGESI
ncbi:MAG: LacI family DNA-binding transcriptional regulator [Enterococcus malodoratus]|uniref:LacI family DNA-binding transcriptional regulator n=1 Tax=Enterococcus malodoratus TaxID=71451 RepID=UPI002072EE63|nr:LacI family DNA-binding transcriptional regulator [Enterococcus malodoratus]